MGDASVPATRPGEVYLVNLDSSDGNGTHWGCLHHSRQLKDTVLWIDSLGLYPSKPLSRSIRRSGRRILANDSWTQEIDNPNDALCGPRAVLYALRLHDAGQRDFDAYKAF